MTHEQAAKYPADEPSPSSKARAVKRYTPNKIANEIMAEDAWHSSEWVRASDHDFEIERLQRRVAELDALVKELSDELYAERELYARGL